MDLSPAQRVRLVTFLCDVYYLSERDAPFLVAHLESTPGGVGFRSQLRHHVLGRNAGVRRAESKSSADVDAAVRVLWWLYRDFQSSWLEFLGFADLASSYRDYLDEACRKPPTFSESNELLGQGKRGILDSLDEVSEAWVVAQVASMAFKTLPRRDATGSDGDYADWWAGRVGLAGFRRHFEGALRVLPLLRGTGVRVSMWLAADQQTHRSRRLVDVLDRVGFTLNRLVANVEAVEEVWENHTRVRDHFDLQRRSLEALVDELTS